MNPSKTVRVLYHMARADFLERTRRYSFLIMLGLVLYLGYAVNAGQITLRLDTYRGIFNSAWVGSMMTLVVNLFLGWFGFYLIKNAITRDYETGVGQIIATTPLSRSTYLLGKWLSNFAVLAIMVVILMLSGTAMQLLQHEAQIQLWALIAPFLFVALPFMALIAAIAILFESIAWLRGSPGNLVYLFVFVFGITIPGIAIGPKVPLLDWIGFNLFGQSMGDAARAVYPGYVNGFSLGVMPPVDIQTFYWAGITWTLPVILIRLATLALGFGIALLGSLFFDRFDTSRQRVAPRNRPPAVREDQVAEPVAELAAGGQTAGSAVAAQPIPAISLTSLPAARFRFGFMTLLLAELRIFFKGQRWWWYVVALGLIVACAAAPLEIVRDGLLPAALIWPILIWSSMGCREASYNTRQMVFSTPRPLRRQLPALWLSGFGVAALVGAGAAVNIGRNGDPAGLLSLMAGMLFIPSLALTLGVWTGSSKAFEVIYVLLWYLGPVNKLGVLDYTTGYWQAYLLLSLLLVVLAVIGRRRQLLI